MTDESTPNPLLTEEFFYNGPTKRGTHKVVIVAELKIEDEIAFRSDPTLVSIAAAGDSTMLMDLPAAITWRVAEAVSRALVENFHPVNQVQAFYAGSATAVPVNRGE